MTHPPIETGADDIAAHPRHTGHRWFDLTMALSAIFISAISLFVAIEHGRIERNLVAANSWPFLREIRSNQYDDGKAIAIGLSNGGVGPAKVVSLQVFYKGQPVASAVDLLRRCCGLSADASVLKRQIPTGAVSLSTVDETVLRAGENDPVVELQRAVADHAVAAAFSEALADVTFKACYCSILDECWTSNLQDIHVVTAKSCPIPAVAFVPNGR